MAQLNAMFAARFEKSELSKHSRDREAAAEIRIGLALDSLQEAQRLSEQAQRALSRVAGMIAHRRNVSSVSDQLTRIWFALSADSSRLRHKRHLRVD